MSGPEAAPSSLIVLNFLSAPTRIAVIVRRPIFRMPAISNSNYSLFSVSQVVLDLSISLETLFALASTENCSFFIDVPDNTDIYFRGYEIIRKNNNFLRRQKSSCLEKGPLIRVHQEIECLCLKPSECLQLLHREKIRVKAFQAVGLMNEDGSMAFIDERHYKKRYPDDMQNAVYMSVSFLTYYPVEASLDWPNRPPQPMNEKSMAIRRDDLLISAEDLNKITLKIRAAAPEYGKFKSQDWTSSMLMDLNEASTLFSSSAQDPDKLKIKSWFQKKWEHKRVGKDVIEQAVNAILPDRFYSKSPSMDGELLDVVKEYNSYASSALILINEAAKRYWKEMQAAHDPKRFAKRDVIITELQEKGLTRKLAGAASTIIRPDEDE